MKTAYREISNKRDEGNFIKTSEVCKRHTKVQGKDEKESPLTVKTVRPVTKARHARREKPESTTRVDEAIWLCRKERMVDALALRADERRDKLRKASGRSKYP